MDYTLLTADEINVLEGFLNEEILEEFSTKKNRYAICALDKETVCGTIVFDTHKVISIVDMCVLPGKRGSIERELLREVIALSDSLDSNGIEMEIYASANEDASEQALINAGFVKTGHSTLYRFYLISVWKSPLMSRVRHRDGVVSLFKATRKQRGDFHKYLVREGLYDRFLSDEISDIYSKIYIQDDVIMGCVLVSILNDQSFCLEFVYIDSENAKIYAMAALIAETVESLEAYYGDVDPVGYTLVTNAKAYKLMRQIIPDAEIIDICTTYSE